MIDGLKPYPKMKDSGVPWLGEVPAHWETRPLKRWVRMNRDVLPEATSPEYEFRYLDIGSVGTGVLTARPQRLRFAAAPSRARRVVSDGDTIVSTVRTYLNAVYFVEGNSDELVCSTGFAVLTPTAGTVPKFVSYLCQSRAFTDRVTADSVGIAYPAIAETRLAAFHVAIPPLPEQTAIVRFLDYMDRRIRRYIRAKQKLIKLLEEQKQAIIHRAVTRGLDPNVRLKPSGVEWLGDVPEHWEVRRAKHLFREVDHRTTTGTEVLLSLRMRRGLVPHADVSTVPITSQALIGFKKIAVGQVVMNRMRAAIGMFGIASEPGLVSPDYAVLEPLVTLDPHYFLRLFGTPAAGTIFRVESKGLGTGSSGFMRLYTDRFGTIKMPVPPAREQQQIVEGIVERTLEIERTTERVNREMRLLREFRTRLIADVVTGKLDVREAAARLPQEAEDVEPLDEAEAEGDAEQSDAGDGDGVPEEVET
jgi:type I restriction enzyme S subunit